MGIEFQQSSSLERLVPSKSHCNCSILVYDGYWREAKWYFRNGDGHMCVCLIFWTCLKSSDKAAATTTTTRQTIHHVFANKRITKIQHMYIQTDRYKRDRYKTQNNQNIKSCWIILKRYEFIFHFFFAKKGEFLVLRARIWILCCLKIKSFKLCSFYQSWQLKMLTLCILLVEISS